MIDVFGSDISLATLTWMVIAGCSLSLLSSLVAICYIIDHHKGRPEWMTESWRILIKGLALCVVVLIEGTILIGLWQYTQ